MAVPWNEEQLLMTVPVSQYCSIDCCIESTEVKEKL